VSEFHVNVVRLGKIEKHQNADTLSVVNVYGGYPCIVRTGEFNEGDLAVYVPVDAVVPDDDPRFAFLDRHWRIRAKRLRGVFSMGLLVKPDPAWTDGQDVAKAMRIIKYEPPLSPMSGAGCEHDPGHMPHYDMDGLRRYPNILQDGEDVVLHEKIHGYNARFLWTDDRLYVASHTTYKKEDDKNLWWVVAKRYHLAEKLITVPGIGIYGEVYGQVQNMKYGVPKNDPYRLAIFDVLDIKTKKFLDYEESIRVVRELGLPFVPLLYRGPWSRECWQYADGESTMPGANHTRDGFVVKPTVERFNPEVGRVIFKLKAEKYLLGNYE